MVRMFYFFVCLKSKNGSSIDESIWRQPQWLFLWELTQVQFEFQSDSAKFDDVYSLGNISRETLFDSIKIKFQIERKLF